MEDTTRTMTMTTMTMMNVMLMLRLMVVMMIAMAMVMLMLVMITTILAMIRSRLSFPHEGSAHGQSRRSRRAWHASQGCVSKGSSG